MQMNARPADIKWMLIQTMATSMWFDKHTSQQDTACEKKQCHARHPKNHAKQPHCRQVPQCDFFLLANNKNDSQIRRNQVTCENKRDLANQKKTPLASHHQPLQRDSHNSDVSQRFESRNKNNVNRNHKCWMLTNSHWTKRLCHHRTLWTSV